MIFVIAFLTFLTAIVVPMLINKSTEGRGDWVKKYLREAWFVVVLVWVAAVLCSPDGVTFVMTNKPAFAVSHPIASYILIAVLTAALACLYWFVLGKMAPPPPIPTTASEESAGVQLSITCDNVALPMAYHGDLWILNTVMPGGGLMKSMPPPKKPEGLWPEDGVHGFGYRCTVRNHGAQAAFGVEISMIVSKLELIRTGDAWTTGAAKETHTTAVRIPQPLGQQDSSQFDFYVCSYDPDGPLDVTLPSTAFINSEDPKNKREVPVKITSIAGNPFTVPPKQPNTVAKINPAVPPVIPKPSQPSGVIPASPIVLTAQIVTLASPAIVVNNLSDRVANGVTWELILFRVSDLAFLSYVTTDIGYIKAGSRSANEFMDLENKQKLTDGGSPQIKAGEEFIGSIAIDCPECKGATYIVHFVWGVSGWMYEVKDAGARIIAPRDMTKAGRQQFVTSLEQSVPQGERVPIR
jgi:hypothetical protein